MPCTARVCLGLLPLVVTACQAYDFVFQPDADRRGVHFNFTVQTPSKADILFVVDNSRSMGSKQTKVAQSITTMLASLAPQDTSYRIGVVSTDAYGVIDSACPGDAPTANPNYLPVVPSNVMSDPRSGSLGNCQRRATGQPVALRRPHDGALGRLLAAYDPAAFAPANFAALSPAAQAAIASMVPQGADSGPVGVNGDSGARFVIDREAIKAEACAACGCAKCSSLDPNYAPCAEPATSALVQAYFQSNVAGLGVNGFGWEEGIKASMWAVGIDPEDADDQTALTPAYDLLANGAPNSYTAVDPTTGTATAGPWLRDDALLAVLYLSDEEDCSMPSYLMQLRSLYEEPQQPLGSVCYQSQPQANFLATARMARLLQNKKGSGAQVAVGVIGGLNKTGPTGAEGRSGEPHDCTPPQPAAATPNNQCACYGSDFATSDPRWCAYTDLHDSSLPICDSLAARRYVAFANNFSRRTFESTCRDDQEQYGAALSDFARIATLACFDLQDTRPYNDDPNNVTVRRTPKGSTESVQLTTTGQNSTAQGWYYDPPNNKICLTGLDRLIGDVYDIFVLDHATLDYTH